MKKTIRNNKKSCNQVKCVNCALFKCSTLSKLFSAIRVTKLFSLSPNNNRNLDHFDLNEQKCLFVTIPLKLSADNYDNHFAPQVPESSKCIIVRYQSLFLTWGTL